MKKLILLSIVLLSLLVAPLSELFAQSRLINYQGNILNQQDVPLQGPVQITFELYSAEFGGSQIWSEIQNVTLNKGYLNVYLGSVTPFPATFNFNRDLWLQVTVGTGSPYQRTRLSMVPYSGYSDRSAVAGLAEDVPDGSITLAKLDAGVKTMGGDLMGQLPNPTLRPGAILENIPDGSITQQMLNANVTTRPSGPAGGDLTGFYPDPVIAAGAVKTDRIADGAVTGIKLANGTITYGKLQPATGPIGTILGWNGTAWVETNVAAWEVDGVIGNEVTNATANQGLVRSGAGTANSPYTLGIGDNGVQTNMLANMSVTYNKLQNASGPAGTILGWNGTSWVETNVSAWEADGVIGNEVLNATPNRGLIRAGLGTLASPYTLGINDGGVETSMLANGSISLSKLAPGSTIGQIMWWDNVSNNWRLSSGPAPVQDKIIKWVNTGSTLEPQWANDDMTIPFEKTITVQTVPLFSLTNNGNSDVMNLTTTGMGDGLKITLPDDMNGGGHALHINGGGLNQPSIMVNRTTGSGLPMGALNMNSTINTLDAESYGLLLNTTVNDDGNNNYDVRGIGNNVMINNGVAGSLYAGIHSSVETNTGTAIGVLGDVDAFSNGNNIGLAGDANNSSNMNIGVYAAANSDYQDVFTNVLFPGFSTGLLAVNQGAGSNDNALVALSDGIADAAYIEADDASAVVASNTSTDSPSILAVNQDSGPSLVAISGNDDDYTAFVENFGTGRGLSVRGGKANDENGGMPLWSDPADADDAALVVYNPNAMSLGGGAPYATAIKTYGDIWANSAVGASEIIGLNRIVVGNPFIGPFIELLPPSFPGAPLTIAGDVEIQGDLLVEDIMADDITANTMTVGTLTATMGTFDNLQVNMNANVDGNTTLGGTLAVTGPTTLNGAATVNNTLNVTGLTTLAGVNATNGMFSGTLGVNGATTLNGAATVNNTLNVTGLTTLAGVNATNGMFSGTLGVTGNTSLSTVSTSGLATLNSAAVTNNATVGGNLTVTGMSNLGVVNSGNTMITGTLGVTGLTTLADVNAVNGMFSGTLGVTGNTSLSTLNTSGLATLNSLVVTGTSNLQGAATLGSTLAVTGASTLNGATMINNTLGVTGHTSLSTLGTSGLATLNSLAVTNNATVGGTLGVTGVATFSNNAMFNGSDVTLSNGTRVIAGGTPGVAGELFASRGAGLSPEWTNTIPQLNVTGTLTTQDLMVNNNAIIAGDLTVNGNDLFINADVTMVGDFDLTGALVADDIVVLNSFVSAGDFDVFSANPITFAGPSLDLTGNFNVTGNSALNGTLGVTGATTIGGATMVNNTLGVTGNTTLGANLRVDGTSDLRGTIFNTELGGGNEINIIDNTNITGNLNVTGGPGQGTISGKELQISQNATISQNLTVNQNSTVNQNFTVAGNTSVQSVDVKGPISNSTLGQPVQVTDDMNITGDLTVSGSINVVNLNAVNGHFTGNLIVDGTTTLNGASTVNNTLNVTGLTTLANMNAANGNYSGTLGVTGLTTLGDMNAANGTYSGTLGVTGNTSLTTVSTSGLASLNSLNVLNNANVNGNLGVTGTSTLGVVNSGNTMITGTLDVTGLTTLANLNATNGTFSGTLSGNTVSATTTVTAGTNLVATNDVNAGGNVNALTGNVNAVNGNFSGNLTGINGNFTTVSATGAITSTGGSITANQSVNAGTSMTAGTGITSTTGNIVAQAGNVTAATTVNAGTDVIATNNVNAGNQVNATNDINSTNGVLVTNGAGNNTMTGNLIVGGTTTIVGSLQAQDLISNRDFFVGEKMRLSVYEGNDLDLSDANVGAVTFYKHTSGGVVTALGSGVDPQGTIIYIYNTSAFNLDLTTNGLANMDVPAGQMYAFIMIAPGGWVRMQ